MGKDKREKTGKEQRGKERKHLENFKKETLNIHAEVFEVNPLYLS